jgi:hypothetical protein
MGTSLPGSSCLILAGQQKVVGGEGTIRTCDSLSAMAAFNTAAINHSATSPCESKHSSARYGQQVTVVIGEGDLRRLSPSAYYAFASGPFEVAGTVAARLVDRCSTRGDLPIPSIAA